MNIEKTIKGMTKAQRDYVGVFGNQWAPRKTTPFAGTCERCVWGKGLHSKQCGWLHPGSWPHSSGE